MRGIVLLGLCLLCGAGCLRPLTERLDLVNRQLAETNDKLQAMSRQLDETNQKLATVERAVRIFAPPEKK
jgi:hypothetical protein